MWYRWHYPFLNPNSTRNMKINVISVISMCIRSVFIPNPCLHGYTCTPAKLHHVHTCVSSSSHKYPPISAHMRLPQGCLSIHHVIARTCGWAGPKMMPAKVGLRLPKAAQIVWPQRFPLYIRASGLQLSSALLSLSTSAAACRCTTRWSIWWCHCHGERQNWRAPIHPLYRHVHPCSSWLASVVACGNGDGRAGS